MHFLDSILQKARAHRQTIVLAEGEDARVIEAARRAQDDGIANCILIGNPDVIGERALCVEDLEDLGHHLGVATDAADDSWTA